MDKNSKLFTEFSQFIIANELSQTDFGNQFNFDLHAIIVRRLVSAIRDFGAGRPLVWYWYDGNSWVPDDIWASTPDLDSAIEGSGLPWSALSMHRPSFDLSTLAPIPDRATARHFEPPANVLSVEPWDTNSVSWLDRVGKTLITGWVDPAIDDSHFYIDNRLGITSSLTFEKATLKSYATGFVQTNIAGFTELICDTQGEMVTPGYLGLAVVNDDAILTTPVGASWNFYGELTDVDGWIQRFSRYLLLPPEDSPKLNF